MCRKKLWNACLNLFFLEIYFLSIIKVNKQLAYLHEEFVDLIACVEQEEESELWRKFFIIAKLKEIKDYKQYCQDNDFRECKEAIKMKLTYDKKINMGVSYSCIILVICVCEC